VKKSAYKTVIGLEVHVQLLTQSKIFSADATLFGQEPNTHVSAITLAHPGTLPKINRRAVELAIRMGIACGSEISRYQIFDRKNYFYPDLPKGYQLTQDHTPICKGGKIMIGENDLKSIQLNRIHLEEDAGKSIHIERESDTLVDFNRAGVPLIEIVTEPVIYNSEDAGAVVAEIRKIVRYLSIGDGNMEEGSLRCDANVSVMPEESTVLGKKVEIKNMNSIRHIVKAIDYEAERQIQQLEQGKEILSETCLYDADTGKTFSMRTKEELNDYRYFPDPDVAPIQISEEWLRSIEQDMPLLPRQWKEKLQTTYELPAYDAEVLTESKELVMYYDTLCSYTHHFKAAANWMMGPVKSYLNDTGLKADDFIVAPEKLAALVNLVEAGKVSFAKAAQEIFPAQIQYPHEEPVVLAQRMNVMQDSNVDFILPLVEQIIREFPLKVEEYHRGKKAIVTMFMGEVMKRSKGKADPKLATQLLLEKLKK
jgi:aspartyl-tRNA(Asn)/glutamyl-tRNA(Gln) amidotransferase subunit B